MIDLRQTTPVRVLLPARRPPVPCPIRYHLVTWKLQRLAAEEHDLDERGTIVDINMRSYPTGFDDDGYKPLRYNDLRMIAEVAEDEGMYGK